MQSPTPVRGPLPAFARVSDKPVKWKSGRPRTLHCDNCPGAGDGMPEVVPTDATMRLERAHRWRYNNPKDPLRQKIA